MHQVRSDEPRYAFLWDKEARAVNRYGTDIETAALDSELRKEAFVINEEFQEQINPNRYKQHGFYLNADNCIGCHACEAACSEKNDNPAHIAFRSVGFVEGGTYPAYQRLNISMACNHCDDPVCLKGCPTRAYTKFAEYGAVLQDPETCFGCGYCTWVCPYNAPQLDPVKGEVSKCNMCVDRLEVGLKPACVSACLGNALDFGVIENTPENRTQSDTEIPGFPRTDITHPNIRFQQTRSLHRDVTRVDSMPLKYHKDNSDGLYKPKVDPKQGYARHWNWSQLLFTHEASHSLFTLSTQAVLGAFWLLTIGGGLLGISALAGLGQSRSFIPLLAVMLVVLSFGLFKLNMHLGKPHRFYRGFNNLRLSPVSREIAGISGFFTGLMGYSFFSLFGLGFTDIIATGFAVLANISGVLGLYYMYKLYRIPARPFWDHWQTASTFVGTAAMLGSLLIAIVVAIATGLSAELLQILVLVAGAGLLLEGTGLFFHRRDLTRDGAEGAASQYVQETKFGYPYLLRNGLLVMNVLLLWVVSQTGLQGTLGLAIGLVLLLSLLVMAYIGRSLFYALVIPTTMPGAFFWKNQGFVDHARETGLADMEQLGVVYEGHHKFDIKALLTTLKDNSPQDMIKHVRWILTGK